MAPAKKAAPARSNAALIGAVTFAATAWAAWNGLPFGISLAAGILAAVAAEPHPTLTGKDPKGRPRPEGDAEERQKRIYTAVKAAGRGLLDPAYHPLSWWLWAALGLAAAAWCVDASGTIEGILDAPVKDGRVWSAAG